MARRRTARAPAVSRYEAAFAPRACAPCLVSLKRRKPLHTSWYSCARIERPPFRVGRCRLRRLSHRSSAPAPSPAARPVVSIHASAWATPCSQSPRPMLRRHRVNGGDGHSMREVFGGGDKFCPRAPEPLWRAALRRFAPGDDGHGSLKAGAGRYCCAGSLRKGLLTILRAEWLAHAAPKELPCAN